MKRRPTESAATWIVHHPWLTMAIVLAGVVLSLLQINTLEIETSASALIDEHDPGKPVYEEFKDVFGSDILTVIMIGPPRGDVFTTETLELVDGITEALWDFDGVTSIQSLTTVRDIRGEDGFLVTDPLVLWIPDDPDELAEIRDQALANPTLVGNVVSADGRYTAINIYSSDEDPSFDKRFGERLAELFAELGGDHDIYQVGGPRYNQQFNGAVAADQKTLLPASVIAIFGLLLISFRDRIAVIVPIVTGGLSIVSTFGFMSWMGYPVGVVSVMVPSLLIVVGCTEDVHLIAEYVARIRAGMAKHEAILDTMRHSSLAVSLTSLTTIFGFFALSLNDVTAIKEFGLIACFGLAANFVITVVMVPGLLHVMPSPDPAKSEHSSRYVGVFLEKVIYINTHHKLAIAVGTIAVTFVAAIGCLRLEVNNDPITYFAEDDPLRQDFGRIHEDLAGAQSFHIMFEVEEEGDIKEPEVMVLIDRLQSHLDDLGNFDRSISVVDFMKLMNREMLEDPGAFVVPDSRGAIAEYLLLLDDEDIFRYIDFEQKRASVAVRHDLSGSAEVKKAIAEVESWLKSENEGYIRDDEHRRIDWHITGESILLHRSADAMVIGQAKSLFLAVGVVLIVMTALFLSLKAGLIAAFSNMLPILIVFGAMGWLGIPFNASTTLIGPLALGIAVDDTIHFMVRYQKVLRKSKDQIAAMAEAIRSEGRPIVTTSVALALGFLVFTLSQFVPSISLGLLGALVMIVAVLVDLFFNPLMLTSVQLITVWDFIALKVNSPQMRNSLIFKDLGEREIKTVALLGGVETGHRGEVLIRQGDTGQAMYLILDGAAVVSHYEDGEQRLLARLDRGSLFGEMALLGEGIRTSTVTADSDIELLRIDEVALSRCLRRNPKVAAKLFVNISRVLVERIRLIQA